MLCRVVPAIVARHPEILSFPKPVRATKHVKTQHSKIRRRINEMIEDKLLEGKLQNAKFNSDLLCDDLD